MNSPASHLSLLTLALGLGLACASLASSYAAGPEEPGQDEVANPPQNPPLRRAIGLKRAELQRYMEMQLQEIERVCSLSASQQAHLRLASKGAVEKCVDDWTDEIHENGWANMVGQVDEDIVDQWLASVAGENVQREVVNQEVWSEAIRVILTESQQTKWQQALAERAAFRRKGAVEQSLVILEMELLLSPHQREEMGKIVDAELGARFEVWGRSPRTVQEFTRVLAKNKVAAVLTEAQLARWDDLVKQAEFMGYDDWNGDMQFFNGQEIPMMAP